MGIGIVAGVVAAKVAGHSHVELGDRRVDIGRCLRRRDRALDNDVVADGEEVGLVDDRSGQRRRHLDPSPQAQAQGIQRQMHGDRSIRCRGNG